MNKVVLIVGILLFVVLGALLPFIRQPEVTEETKESLDLSRFPVMNFREKERK